MGWKDLDKRRKWYREYYHANKKSKSVKTLLIEENEKLKKENEELRKKVVLLRCPDCGK